MDDFIIQKKGDKNCDIYVGYCPCLEILLNPDARPNLLLIAKQIIHC